MLCYSSAQNCPMTLHFILSKSQCPTNDSESPIGSVPWLFFWSFFILLLTTSILSTVVSLLFHKCIKYSFIFGPLYLLYFNLKYASDKCQHKHFQFLLQYHSSKRPFLIILNKSCISVLNSMPVLLPHPTHIQVQSLFSERRFTWQKFMLFCKSSPGIRQCGVIRIGVSRGRRWSQPSVSAVVAWSRLYLIPTLYGFLFSF